jgi:hypothetical protein
MPAQAEYLRHEVGILIDAQTPLRHQLCTEGLDEADPSVPFSGQIQQSKAGGGLAAMLTGRRYEYPVGHGRSFE